MPAFLPLAIVAIAGVLASACASKNSNPSNEIDTATREYPPDPRHAPTPVFPFSKVNLYYRQLNGKPPFGSYRLSVQDCIRKESNYQSETEEISRNCQAIGLMEYYGIKVPNRSLVTQR